MYAYGVSQRSLGSLVAEAPWSGSPRRKSAALERERGLDESDPTGSAWNGRSGQVVEGEGGGLAGRGTGFKLARDPPGRLEGG
jgi:hypothetical protein